jgi:flavin-dependent dehydrogenase
MLVGDAAGMISPFNGEGIAYALQAGRVAADAIVQSTARGTAAGRERALATYGTRMKDDLGGYYTLGRVFVKLIEHPQVMRACTKYGLPRPLVMKFTHKLLADCYETRGGDMVDKVIAGLARLAPAS